LPGNSKGAFLPTHRIAEYNALGQFLYSALNDAAGTRAAPTLRAAVSWRIGIRLERFFESSLTALTQDVSPVLIHFGKERTPTWLLVRMPEPAGQPQTLPGAPETAAQNQGVEASIFHRLFAHFPLRKDELSFAQP
jgi:hypothetical protein